MPRMRTIKPEFFSNEHLAVGDPLLALLFAGLWCWADREGRLEDRPTKLHIEILPRRDCDVDALLDELARLGFILRYASGDLRLIQVLKFGRHQNPHRAEKRSTLPAPDGQAASTVQEPGKNGAGPVSAPRKARASRAGHESWAMGHGVPAMEPQQQAVVHDSLSVAESDESGAAGAEEVASKLAPEREPTGSSPADGSRRARAGPARRRAMLGAFEDVERWRTPANGVEMAQRVAAARALLDSAPPVTPAEVPRLVKRWDQDHDPALCTPMALARNLTQLRGPPATKSGRRRGAPFRDDRTAAEKAREPVRAWRETWTGDAGDGEPLQHAGGGST